MLVNELTGTTPFLCITFIATNCCPSTIIIMFLYSLFSLVNNRHDRNLRILKSARHHGVSNVEDAVICNCNRLP